jgi:hypothetical protein
MRYILSKIAITVFCLCFIAFSLNMHSRFSNGFGLFDAAFVLVPIIIWLSWWRQLSRFQKMTYFWYKEAYPACVQENRMSCFVCGGTNIQVRKLMNRTFHREHFCAQCGKTLYFSPEQG